MCGIAGVLHFDGRQPTTEAIKCMIDAIAHRGPDAEGVQLCGSVGLGHRRLAILDLSDAGKQPMSDQAGKLWITYNGEIYNFLEIRRELESRGYHFTSVTDTEVILYAYREWGVECIQRFNGMFAFALWDETKQSLWVARDRIGIKPLFYAQDQHRFLFGSEMKAILAHPEFQSRCIDYQALAYFLATNYTPAPYTLLADIRQLLPGHMLLISHDGQVQDIAYWELIYEEGDYRDDATYLEEYAALLEDAVRLQLISDVPFGAFLSGGVDSSTIAYWMSKQLNEPLKTFTIGFGEATFDELDYARQVADSLNTEHHERIVKADHAQLLSKLVWHAEEPTADSSMVAVYAVAELARESVTMVHSGDGADETLAGYETYQAYYLHRLYRSLPALLRQSVIEPMVGRLPASDSKLSRDAKLRRFVYGGRYASSEDAHALWRIIFTAEARAELLTPLYDKPGVKADILDLYRAAFAQTNARHPVNRMLYVDTRVYLPSDMLVKVDRMTMAHGLEARVPFLDHRLVEFTARVPPHLKLNGYRRKKHILKTVMRGKLPETILTRKKAGFNVPNARWIKGGLKPFVLDQLSPAKLKRIGWFESGVVEKLLHDHFEERSDHSHQIWSLLTLSLWWSQFIDGERAS